MKNILLYLLLFPLFNFAQDSIAVAASFDIEKKQIKISQFIRYKNTSNKTLDTIYLQDWSNSFSSRKTPLGKRFEEEFKSAFIFSKKDDFGRTLIQSISQDSIATNFTRLPNQQDILKVALPKKIAPKDSYNIQLQYIIKIPNDKFTRYGFTNTDDLKLRFWYITPAVFDGKWHYFSNKDLNDAFVPKATISITAKYPNGYALISELNTVTSSSKQLTTTTLLEGKNRVNDKLYLVKNNTFKTIAQGDFDILYNLDEEKLKPKKIKAIAAKVTKYLQKNLGNYPHKKLLVTNFDYKNNQIYGLNSLPDFIRPYANDFQFEIKLLKTALNNYLENTLLINQRENQWVFDSINLYFFIKYIEEYYPNTKLLGALSKFWGIRSYHTAQLQFNDHYNFLYMNMARTGKDQPLSMRKDSLLKFNANLANKYKAGIGLHYLNNYIGNNSIENNITQFLKQNTLKIVSPKDFKQQLQTTTPNSKLNWFFNEYVATNSKIDYKLKKLRKVNDSIYVTIKNNRNNTMPISLTTLNKDSVLSEQWIDGFKGEKTLALPNNNATRISLNYDTKIPEINARNNSKKIKGFVFKNRPLQPRFFQDFENPKRNQIFFIPEAYYNYYDGVTAGIKAYNESILLTRNFNYRVSPKYGFKSKELVGGFSTSYRFLNENKSNYYIKLGLSGRRYNYNETINANKTINSLEYRSLTPYIDFVFRNKNDYRDNKKSALVFRHVSISRETDPTGKIKIDGEPSYSVFNARFITSDPNLNSFYSWANDFQLAKNFSKIATTLELRTITDKNRQYNLRLFGGAFLFNNTYKNSNFYSFALDRPTDYLFDYDYIGRSEETGLLSQEIIIAEGGFKSKLPMPYANSWIATANASTTIWKYVLGYFDVGFVGNYSESPKFAYDSGVRVNLVADYFELYFPVYSNLGWEVAQNNYSNKIRFVVSLSINTLTGLFKRRWY